MKTRNGIYVHGLKGERMAFERFKWREGENAWSLTIKPGECYKVACLIVGKMEESLDKF